MKIFAHQELRHFHFWSGAADNAAELTNEQLDDLDAILSDMYPDGIDETTLNDIMWFDFDTIKEWLGIEDEEQDEDEDYDEEDEDE